MPFCAAKRATHPPPTLHYRPPLRPRCAVVIVLSREYLYTRRSMKELQDALDRLQSGASTSGEATGPGPMLLPVLLDGLTIDDLVISKSAVYRASSWPSGLPKPGDDELERWANLLGQIGRMRSVYSMKGDQVGPRRAGWAARGLDW